MGEEIETIEMATATIAIIMLFSIFSPPPELGIFYRAPPRPSSKAEKTKLTL
jgi:hypothetical protein